MDGQRARGKGGAINTPNIPPPATELADDIVERLRSLPYSAYVEVIAIAMEKAGYFNTNVLRSARGRNADGGVDLVANVNAGFVTLSAVVQAKQYSDPVQKRYVQEIRGAAIGANAQHAAIITTASFSESAHSEAAKGASLPVALIDGHALASLMSWHRIGVIRTKDGLAIDPAFFEGLARRHEKVLNRLDKLDANHKRSFLTVKLWFGDHTSSSESPRCGS